MTRILHTADTHIGTRQYGLAERRADFSGALFQVVELACAEEVRAVIHSGDLFDSRNPSTEDLRDVLQALLRLREAGIPFLAVVGNHEQKRGVQWLDLFASLGVAVHLGGEPSYVDDIPIWGLDYAGRREVELPRREGGVLVAHQMLDRVDPVRGELKFEGLLRSGADLVLLGDYHEHRSWWEGGVLVTYPGSTERWRASERGPRGCSIIDLKTERIERRNLQTRRFVYIEEDEDPLRGLAARAQDLEGAVVCVYLSDSGHTAQEIEEEALRRGALAVQLLERRAGLLRGEEGIDVTIEVEVADLDELLSRELAQLRLSPHAREIDAIIRDERVPDSNVDLEVTGVLEGGA
jgi:DNA repair exonuclease SbcCD nuclease subunit